MNMNIYMSDLDGTLLNSNAVLSSYTIENLNYLLDTTDINFSIATARTPATVVPLLKDLNLKLPLVVMNGAATYNLKEARYTHYNSIPQSSVFSVIDILRKQNLSFFTYTLKDEHIYVYFDNEPSLPQQRFMDERKGSPLKSFIKGSIPENSEILYLFIMDDKDKILSVFDEINQVPKVTAYAYEDIYDRDAYILEIFNEKSSKASSIKRLMNEFNFSNLTVFGDNFNDIPMFEFAENRIAVKNAVQKLKEMSTKVIDSNNDNGVINYLLDEFKKR